MVILPFQAAAPTDPCEHAGWEAEQTLAHFLDREFANARNILLFHGLRFRRAIVAGRAPENTDDFTQIDHLILHPHGGAIAESKSVSGELRVDALGQWTRTWGSRSGRHGTHRIFSPIEQAKRQRRALVELLDLAEPPLLNKLLGVAQSRFGGFPVRALVAISERGEFHPAKGVTAKDVMKADQIPPAVRADIDAARAGAGFFGLIRSAVAEREATNHNLTPAELERISAYLLAKHTPLTLRPRTPAIKAPRPAEAAAPRPAPATSPTQPTPRREAVAPAKPPAPPARPDAPANLDPLVCIKCASMKIEVVYRRDYCILCAECQKYTALGLACPSCGQRTRIRKQGKSFYRDCEREQGGCGASTLFWVNA